MDLYEIFKAVLYILRTGSQWRQLPHDFPNWQTVYGYFRRWSEPIDGVGHSSVRFNFKKIIDQGRLRMGFGTDFIHITTANVSERDGAVALLALNSNQFYLVKRVMADGGYTGENFAGLVQSTIGAEIIIAKQSGLKYGWIILQRWVVERSFS